MKLTLKQLCEANQKRQDEWPGASRIDEVFIALEVAEEAGEVAGAVKKITRFDRGIAGNKGKTREVLLQNLKDEIADTFINVSRLCNAFGIDPDECVRKKFNETSDMVGVKVFL